MAFCLHCQETLSVQGLIVPSYSIMKVKTKYNKVVIFSYRTFPTLAWPLYTNIDIVIVIARYVFLNSCHIFYLTCFYEENGDYMLPDRVR